MKVAILIIVFCSIGCLLYGQPYYKQGEVVCGEKANYHVITVRVGASGEKPLQERTIRICNEKYLPMVSEEKEDLIRVQEVLGIDTAVVAGAVYESLKSHLESLSGIASEVGECPGGGELLVHVRVDERGKLTAIYFSFRDCPEWQAVSPDIFHAIEKRMGRQLNLPPQELKGNGVIESSIPVSFGKKHMKAWKRYRKDLKKQFPMCAGVGFPPREDCLPLTEINGMEFFPIKSVSINYRRDSSGTCHPADSSIYWKLRPAVGDRYPFYATAKACTYWPDCRSERRWNNTWKRVVPAEIQEIAKDYLRGKNTFRDPFNIILFVGKRGKVLAVEYRMPDEVFQKLKTLPEGILNHLLDDLLVLKYRKVRWRKIMHFNFTYDTNHEYIAVCLTRGDT